MRSGILLTIAVPLFALTAGCANLKGIPVGLTTCDAPGKDASGNDKGCATYRKDALAGAADLKSTLMVAESLSSLYIAARDDNLNYAFYSNVLYFPLGIGAAVYTAQKTHKNALVNVGIAAGALAAVNTFVNARPNSKVYQAGITAIQCLTIQMQPYAVAKAGESKAIGDKRNDLDGRIGDANNVLRQMDPFVNAALIGDDAKAERTRNPSLTDTLASSRKALTSAIAEAQKGVDAAGVELGKFRDASQYAKNKVAAIDKFVETKITQPDVSFQTLLKSLQPASSTPAAATPTAKPGGQGSPKSASTTPIQSIIADALSLTAELTNMTKELTALIAGFGLTAAEKAVEDCITSM